MSKTENGNILLRDSEEKSFRDYTELKQFLVRQVENDDWRELNISHAKINRLEQLPIFAKQIAEKYGIDEEVISSTMTPYGSGLLFYPNGKIEECIPIRLTALESLADRAGLHGPSITKAYRECCGEKAKSVKTYMGSSGTNPDVDWYLESQIPIISFLNLGFSLWDEKNGKALIRDGKLSAFHSDTYVVLPQDQLLEILTEEMDANFPGWQMTGASVTHELTQVKFVFPEQKDEIMLSLNRALKRTGKTAMDGMPVLEFCSSDTANAGANIFTGIYTKHMYIRTGEILRVKHFGDASLADFRKNCNQIYSMFKDATERLKKLDAMQVQYPSDMFLHLAKKQGLSKKLAFAILPEFDAERPVQCTALDVYLELWKIDARSNTEKMSKASILHQQEQIARVLNMDLQKYDHPFSWD